MGHLNLHKAKQPLSIICLSNSPELLYISPFKFSNYEQRQIYLLTDLNNSECMSLALVQISKTPK